MLAQGQAVPFGAIPDELVALDLGVRPAHGGIGEVLDVTRVDRLGRRADDEGAQAPGLAVSRRVDVRPGGRAGVQQRGDTLRREPGQMSEHAAVPPPDLDGVPVVRIRGLPHEVEAVARLRQDALAGELVDRAVVVELQAGDLRGEPRLRP